MKMSRTVLAALIALAISSLSSQIVLPQADAQSTNAQSPDNSAQNKSQSPTADTQTNAKADRMTAAQVRKAIIADKDLSMYAHNVKILVLNGAVTLKGPVKTDDERQKVATDAASVAPADKVSNQLKVKQ